MILINHIGEKHTSLNSDLKSTSLKSDLINNKSYFFANVKTKACNINLQGNHSAHESSLHRKSETFQSLSLLDLRAVLLHVVLWKQLILCIIVFLFVCLFLSPGNVLCFLWFNKRFLGSRFLFKRTLFDSLLCSNWWGRIDLH